MVTLTNTTTSSPSLTDATVSTPSRDNVNYSSRLNQEIVGNDVISSEARGRSGAGYMGVQFDVTEEIYAGFGYAYIQENSTPAGIFLSIHEDDGDTVGALLYSSDEQQTPASNSWVQFSFPTTAKLQPGTYWLCLQFEDGAFWYYTGLLSGKLRISGSLAWTGSAQEIVPSVYSSANNFCVYLQSKDSLTPVATTTGTIGYTTTYSFISVDTNDVIKGVVISDFEGGTMRSIWAYLDPSSVITGSTIVGVYVDGVLQGISSPFTYTSYSSTAYWQEFTVPQIALESGTLTLVIHSDAAMHIERTSSQATSLPIISINQTYDGSLPERIASSSTSAQVPQIYMIYEPYLLTNQAPSLKTWSQVTSTWAATTSTWETFTDNVQLTNV